uniref:Putative ovule protein n=1 Tax=Solanum chacoense TaxID=4108 RepID=A0A0V0HTJ8_SOLCH
MFYYLSFLTWYKSLYDLSRLLRNFACQQSLALCSIPGCDFLFFSSFWCSALFLLGYLPPSAIKY